MYRRYMPTLAAVILSRSASDYNNKSVHQEADISERLLVVLPRTLIFDFIKEPLALLHRFLVPHDLPESLLALFSLPV